MGHNAIRYILKQIYSDEIRYWKRKKGVEHEITFHLLIS
jgi:hypothetical protein